MSIRACSVFIYFFFFFAKLERDRSALRTSHLIGFQVTKKFFIFPRRFHKELVCTQKCLKIFVWFRHNHRTANTTRELHKMWQSFPFPAFPVRFPPLSPASELPAVKAAQKSLLQRRQFVIKQIPLPLRKSYGSDISLPFTLHCSRRIQISI